MIKLSLIRKIFVVLILITPLFTDLACRKQIKCGCGEDVIFTLTKQSVYVYFNLNNKSAYFADPYDLYSSYSFCNPEDMMSTLSKFKSGDQLLLSGDVFYECNYLLNAGNNPYYAQYKVYMVQVTEVEEDLYRK
jgi:hypothetical protein